MKEQFVTYEIAKELKELGFDEECLCTYTLDGNFWRNPSNNMVDEEIEQPYTWLNSKLHNSVITAPLWQQCMDWFRDVHDIDIVITPDSSSRHRLPERLYFATLWIYKINLNVQPTIIKLNDNRITFWVDPLKAKEAAILKAIELIKD
jgi:hypothetical protein